MMESARKAFLRWKNSSAWERSQLLNEAAGALNNHQEEFARLISNEVGKPITLARAEVSRAIGVLGWAAAEAQRFAGELLRLDAGANGRQGFGIHTRFPRGVILGITPFNFPLNLVIHKVAPAIASGNAIIIKPSPAAPRTALRMAELFKAVPGLVQVLEADDATTARLTHSPEIDMISFTGSVRVGWMIRHQAAEKPCALELGGNAWAIIGEDTPESLLPSIAKRLANAAFGYAGQSCISVQNVAVSEKIYGKFEEHLIHATETTPYGDPALDSVITGPVINATAKNRIEQELAQLPGGARIIARSQTLEGEKKKLPNLIAPALVFFEKENHASLSSIVGNEIFGPVMTVRKFQSLDDVIAKVNSSSYGLQAGVFTQHWPTIERLYRELQVGGLVVNDVPTTRYDHQPYGGIKESGQGREGVRYAMEEMTESKFLALSSQMA